MVVTGRARAGRKVAAAVRRRVRVVRVDRVVRGVGASGGGGAAAVARVVMAEEVVGRLRGRRVDDVRVV